MLKTSNLIQMSGGFKVTKFIEAVENQKQAYADVVIIDSYTDKDKVEHKRVAYFKAFGKRAERLNKAQKGSVIIEGHFDSSEYEGKTTTFNVIDQIVALFESKN